MRERKQVLVEVSLYNRIKGKAYAHGKTFSDWLEQKMTEEIEEESYITISTKEYQQLTDDSRELRVMRENRE